MLKYQGSTPVASYTHGLNIDEPLAKTDITTGEAYYYHQDALRSVVALTDGNGTIKERYKYSSFGEPTIFDENGQVMGKSRLENPYLFTGSRGHC